MKRAVLLGLFETLVTRYDPSFSQRDRVGVHQILSLDVQTVRAHFDRTRIARIQGKAWTRRRIIAQLATLHGARIDNDLLERYEEQLRARKSSYFRRIDRDVRGMLTAFRDRGLRVGVVANCEYLEEQYYLASEFPELVDTAVASCEIGFAKPDPEIYDRALASLRVPANEAVYIGAGMSRELQGAEAGGLLPLQAYWFIRRLDESHRKHTIQPYPRLLHPMDALKHLD